MTKFLKLIQVLCTKIFHDFSGSIGAINNCLDLCDHKNQWISSQSQEIVLSEMKNLIAELKLHKFIFGYDEGDLLIDNNNINKYFLYLENLSDTALSLEIRDHVQINLQVLKSLFCLVKLELEYGKNNKHKKIKVLFDKEQILIIIEGNESEYMNKLLKFFEDICEDITLTNCYLHYIKLLSNEASYTLELEKEHNIRKYIFNHQ